MIDDTWSRILTLIRQMSPEIAATLRPAASSDELSALEARVGQPMPDGFRSYLQTCDGQSISGQEHPLVGHNRFIGVDEIIQLMTDQIDAFQNEAIPEARENLIRPVMWDASWIPFSELNGQMLIIDLNPGVNGTHGQIFQSWPGFDVASDHVVCAPSFEAFSKEFSRRLRQRDFQSRDGVIHMESGGRPWVV